jgi:hypothetical protein
MLWNESPASPLILAIMIQSLWWERITPTLTLPHQGGWDTGEHILYSQVRWSSIFFAPSGIVPFGTN